MKISELAQTFQERSQKELKNIDQEVKQTINQHKQNLIAELETVESTTRNIIEDTLKSIKKLTFKTLLLPVIGTYGVISVGIMCLWGYNLYQLKQLENETDKQVRKLGEMALSYTEFTDNKDLIIQKCGETYCVAIDPTNQETYTKKINNKTLTFKPIYTVKKLTSKGKK